MSDHIIDYDVNEMRHIAKLWNKLSTELSDALHSHKINDSVEVSEPNQA